MGFGNLKKIIAGLAFVIVLLVVSFFLREFISNYIVRFNLESIEEPGGNSRVLVFSPHNDDEVLGAGELIKKTIKSRGQVRVVLVTNGDGYKRAIEFDYFNLHPKPKDYIKFGYQRQTESINALKTLGLSEDNIIFLGYPDGGIAYLWNANWDKDSPYTSSFTQTNKSPYNNSYTKGALYSGESLAADVSKIIKEYEPTHIVIPHPEDRHPDHWATNAFVKYVLAVTDYMPFEEWLYLVHRGDWPTPMKKSTNMYLVPPAKLMNIGFEWFALKLDRDDIDEKTRVLQFYKTQARTLGLLISAFERKNELFGEYSDLTTIKHENNDASVAPDSDNRIIQDPIKDALKLQIDRSSDISEVHAEVSKENNFHIFIKVNGKINRDIKYDVRMLLINGSKVRRIDITAEGGRLFFHHLSSLSIVNPVGTSLDYKGSYIHVIIPYNIISPANHIFITADSSVQDHLIDKTAWRMLNN